MSHIIWNNINSNNIKGLMITNLPPITKPKKRVNTIKIDGRDGDIIENLGYESYTKTLGIGLYGDYNLDEIMKYFTGKGNLTLSNEPDKFYECEIIDEINYESLLRFKKASVKFYTKPYKYLVGESYYYIRSKDVYLDVENKGLEVSKPLLYMKGTGIVEIRVDGINIFKYDFGEKMSIVNIDSEIEDAYYNEKLLNQNMLGDFVLLKSGISRIEWSGDLTDLLVYPRSRWL